MRDGAMRATDNEITVGLRWVVIGVALVLAGTLLGVLLEAGDTDLLDVDVLWNGLVSSFAPVMQPIAMVLNAVGGGWIATYLVPLVGAGVLVLVRRPWSALAFVAASIISAGVVQVLKAIFGRARPEDMLVISDHGSFPSGHTANAATIAMVAVVLFPRVWVAVVGCLWVALMAFGRTQVHAHWLTDTVGGTMVGAGAALVVCGAFVVPILRERERRLARLNA